MTLSARACVARVASSSKHSLPTEKTLSFSTTAHRPPNRMSSIYTRMKTTCSEEMKAYAKCVTQHHQDGSLKQNTCDIEFASVQNCFRSIRQHQSCETQ